MSFVFNIKTVLHFSDRYYFSKYPRGIGAKVPLPNVRWEMYPLSPIILLIHHKVLDVQDDMLYLCEFKVRLLFTWSKVSRTCRVCVEGRVQVTLSLSLSLALNRTSIYLT